MATIQSVKEKIQGLIEKSNNTTGESAADLNSAVDFLIDGYGHGTEGGVIEFDPTDPGLKYFSYILDLKRKEVILCSVAWGKYKEDTGSYDNLIIPDTLGGFNVVINSSFIEGGA